jgi:polyhydroxybutyrate depolymerase
MPRPVLTFLSLLLVATSLAVPALAQSDTPIRDALRERFKDRIEERRAERRPAAPQASGLQQIALTHQGVQRTYYVDPATMRQGAPIVLVFHGGAGEGAGIASTTRFAAYARQNGFGVVFPNSADKQWNDGRPTTASNIDDVGFVRAVASDVRARYGVDTGRLFAAGISNGGMFTQRLACEASDLFRAYGVVVANMPTSLIDRCRPTARKPMIFFNGTDDRLMPFGGGEVAAIKILGVGAGGSVVSQAQTESFWTQVNGCGGGRTEALADRVQDGTRVVRESFDCAGSVDLEFYVVEGGGHNWPGSTPTGSRLAGNVSQEVDATQRIVAFFQRYGL